MNERKRMNKTIKIIGIVLLALGVLAIVGGVGSTVISRHLIGQGMPALNQPNNPHFRGGERSMMEGRNLPDDFRGIRGFGFFRLPLCLFGGGLTLLVAGTVLLIFNRKIAAAVEPVDKQKEKTITKSAVVTVEKAPAAKKTARKKSA
jgi:hypothetical protein